MNDNREDIFIRWLNNELTEGELRELDGDAEFEAFKKINAEVETWKLPALESESYERLQAKKDPGHSAKWYQTTYLKIAASLVFVATLAIYLVNLRSTVRIETATGETRVVMLPDSTKITLAPSSFITYNNRKWVQNRQVELEGSAYFDVVSGGNFEVAFEAGTVNVLGTEFEIKSFGNQAMISCYDGEVSVNHGQNTMNLVRGKGLRIDNEDSFEQFQFENLTWQIGYSKFQSSPLAFVFSSIESTFNVTIETEAVDENRKFTGTHSTTDLDEALQVVSQVMNLKFAKDRDHIIFSPN